ncbi:MAG: hypothetical protein ACD_22C00170G0001 [uncultured bacterium]|nr:MAG: hypothetical protein ACD_22C00170G0001 [uncultured bacterium]
MSEPHKDMVRRDNDYKRITDLMKTGESICLVAKRGVGKSRFLRYLSTEELLKKQHINNSICIYYLDLRSFVSTTNPYLISKLCELFEVPEGEQPLTKKIKELINLGKKVYVILDHFECLNNFENSSIEYLRFLRDSNKGSMGYIASYPDDYVPDAKVEPIKTICMIKHELKPMNQEEMTATVKDIAKRLDYKISKQQIDGVIKLSDGIARNAKYLVSQLMTGVEDLQLPEYVATTNIPEEK